MDNDFEDIEVIVVNDGSTDNSLSVINTFAGDDRIKIISQENRGLSYTRNVGIEQSNGRYIMFVDSDDKIYDGGVSFVRDAINDCSYSDSDIYVISMSSDPDLQAHYTESFKSYSGEECAAHYLTRAQKTWPSVQFVVKKSYIDSMQIRFKEGYLHEDVLWTTTIFTYATNVVDLNAVCYFQREHRAGSITNTVNPKRVLDVWELVNIAQTMVIEREFSPVVKTVILNRLAQAATTVLYIYKKSSCSEKANIEKKEKLFIQILRYGTTFKIKVFRFLCIFLGLKRAIRFMKG